MANNELLIELYKRIYLIRNAEVAIQNLYPENDMKTPMHMSMGEESAIVGVVSAVEGDAQFFGYYRSHALYLAVSQDIDSFFAEMYGKETGSSRGRAGSMHLAYPEKKLLLASAIVSSTIAPAVGAAFANKYRGSDEIAVCFFGDGAMEEGVFWESLNTACLLKLPVLFVCLDNGLAVDSPSDKRQGFKSISQVVNGFNMIYGEDDSSDPCVINKLASATQKAMVATQMPAFLRLNYYRVLQHIGIKTDFEQSTGGSNTVSFERTGYRSTEERDNWLDKDPLRVVQNLISEADIPNEIILSIESSIDRKIKEAINSAKSASFPGLDELTLHLFTE
jgi:TPP-dependent pyruvate/acetoin dehydrogenase alpha subunit